jgi:3-hydroxybutyryl-CoA dehydrogenase
MTASSSSVDRLRRIGVIGAGQMGAGIAHVCVLAGLEVVLTDVHEEALRRVTQTIISNLSRQVGSGKIREVTRRPRLGACIPAPTMPGSPIATW